ncbi:MAG: glycoside hydrolase family 44 protein [Acidobacteriota bacterium]
MVGEVADASLLPVGSAADRFVEETLAGGSKPLMTMPMIGWAPVDRREKLWAFSQQKYGPQTSDECRLYGDDPPFWCTADSGNGRCDPAINTTGFCSSEGLIRGNDPADTSQPIGPSWVGDWVRHLVSRFGSANTGGTRLYALDNEPMLWDSTHRDLVTEGLDYDGLWDRTVRYAQAIKAADPGAETLGPVVWGWCAYFTSAADTQRPGSDCLTGPDRNAHGGLPLLEWMLEQSCSLEASTGFRALDYLDVHYYPQGGVAGVTAGEDSEDPDTAARRLRSTRELWDADHVAESWIGQPVRLIPRLRSWIDDRCPGTKLALTEYRWGGDDGLSSALAQVEILAIFGREGVDLATRWVAPEEGSLVEDAFRLFLDYDGNGSQLTGTSVGAASSDDSVVSSWAIESNENTYLVLVNKDTRQRPARVDLNRAGVQNQVLETYRLTSSGYDRVADRSATDGRLTINLPARSAALLVAPGGGTVFEDDFETGDLAPWTVIANP